MSEKIYDLAKEAAVKAVGYDRSGNYSEAVKYYLKAFDLLMSIVQYSKNKRLNEYYTKTAENYINRVYEIKEKKLDIRHRDVPSVVDREQKEIIDGTIIMEKPDVKWDEIAGLLEAKRAIYDAVILPLQRQDLFRVENRIGQCFSTGLQAAVKPS